MLVIVKICVALISSDLLFLIYLPFPISSNSALHDNNTFDCV